MNSRLAAASWLAVHRSLSLSPPARSACALRLAWGCYSFVEEISPSFPPSLLPAWFAPVIHSETHSSADPLPPE